MKTLKLLILLLISGNFVVSAKEDTTKAHLPQYIEISYGLAPTGFRDYATSPLIYSGLAFSTSITHIELNDARESSVRFQYNRGNLSHDYYFSKLNSFNINYLELFQLKRLSNNRFNTKIGGQWTTTANVRINEDLFNNGFGFETITNLMLASKVTMDVSRTTSKKFFFRKKEFQPRKRDLSFGIYPGIMNNNLRNGFTYIGQAALLNNEEILDEYQFNFLKGQRIMTTLDYTIWLKNNNGFQFSYRWDYLKTGGNHNEFEMYSHLLTASLCFHLI